MNKERHYPYYVEHVPYKSAKTSKSLAYKGIRDQCQPVVLDDGKTYYLKMKQPASNANWRKSRKSVRHSLPVYTQKTFPEAPDGLYAWIMSDKGFFAIFVDNKLEFGTRHAQLADRVFATEIYLAGELEKTRRNILYNLLSGTFMYKIQEERYFDKNFDFIGDARKLFLDMKLTPLYSEDTVFHKPASEANLRRYSSYGYIIELYDTEAECNRSEETYLKDKQKQYHASYEKSQGYIESTTADLATQESKLQRLLELQTRVAALQSEKPTEDTAKIVEDVNESIRAVQALIATLKDSLAFWTDNAVFYKGMLITAPRILGGHGRKTRRKKRL